MPAPTEPVGLENAKVGDVPARRPFPGVETWSRAWGAGFRSEASWLGLKDSEFRVESFVVGIVLGLGCRVWDSAFRA